MVSHTAGKSGSCIETDALVPAAHKHVFKRLSKGQKGRNRKRLYHERAALRNWCGTHVMTYGHSTHGIFQRTSTSLCSVTKSTLTHVRKNSTRTLFGLKLGRKATRPFTAVAATTTTAHFHNVFSRYSEPPVCCVVLGIVPGSSVAWRSRAALYLSVVGL